MAPTGNKQNNRTRDKRKNPRPASQTTTLSTSVPHRNPHSAQSHRQRSSSHNDPEYFEDPCGQLQRLMQDVESTRYEKKPGEFVVLLKPTEKAILARNGYILEKTIGNGNYSKVKLAKDVLGNSGQVAIKIVNCSSAPKDFLRKFLPRELQFWPQLRHPHIIRMHNYFKDKTHNKVYMILEYACNGDLLTHIQKCGAASEYQGRNWTNQLASAVCYLHNLHITHRDLKLENILLDCHQNVKICDFGFSKTGMGELSNTFCGSKAYASPEILLSQPYDPKKSDIWALGVITYIIVTGRMPFDEHVGSNRAIVERQRLLRLSWGKKVISRHCKDLVRGMLTFDYKKRMAIEEVLQSVWLSLQKRLRSSQVWNSPEKTLSDETRNSPAERKNERGTDGISADDLVSTDELYSI